MEGESTDDLLVQEVRKRLPGRGEQGIPAPDTAEALLHLAETYDKRTLVLHKWAGRYYRLAFWLLKGLGLLILLQSGIDIDHILNRRQNLPTFQQPVEMPLPANPENPNP